MLCPNRNAASENSIGIENVALAFAPSKTVVDRERQNPRVHDPGQIIMVNDPLVMPSNEALGLVEKGPVPDLADTGDRGRIGGELADRFIVKLEKDNMQLSHNEIIDVATIGDQELLPGRWPGPADMGHRQSVRS